MSDLGDFHGRVLVVEDNYDIAGLLMDFFTEKGHITDCANDGLTALHLISANEYDVVLLDLALPGVDGISLCQRIRQELRKNVPVLMLTARDSLDDKLIGFDAGADDYLVKPFELKEVYARVLALWRRSKHGGNQSLKVADLEMDLATLNVTRAGQRIKLNPVRLKLLRLLMEQTNRVVTRRELESYVWGDDPTESDSLRTHLSAIRQAVDKPFDQKILHTIHGIGYRLCDEKSI